ncbi:MAG: S8 family serine peptidase [Chthoniobacterales bacterium]|nr:S8 family serine peptidase [Chthoniobacterales bacterium]
MKLRKLLDPVLRLPAGRITFVITSCLAAAAVTVAAPSRTSQSTSAAISTASVHGMPAPTEGDALPAYMGDEVNLMIELDAPPAATIFAEALKLAEAEAATRMPAPPLANAQNDVLPRVEVDAAATTAVQSHIALLDGTQQALLPSLANAGVDVLYRTQRAFNGIAVRAAADQIAELSRLPGVKSVRPITPLFPSAFSDINFLGTQAFWNKASPSGGGNVQGQGVKIAVIDSGLDYIHSNFGGPGTTPAQQGITDLGPVPNAFFPSEKVPFGFDFAGDDYAFPATPKPDNNPLDSAENGHGTAVASLAAGFGVNFGGTTYTGPYDNSTPFGTMKIAPGFAPRAQIIPLRVFGKSGSSALVTQAIDYAMDPNNDGNFNDRVDVINMSLGSNNGAADDASAVASSNAAAAGIIVVASAGNAGDTYYITGSPGTGTGTLSVAASFNDQAGFIYDVNLRVNLPSRLAGSRSFAIYGAESPRVPDNTTRDVVQARSTADANPAEGCSAFTNAAQVAGKIAFVDRGSCSFSLKIQNAQAAGAIGVIVGNNAGDPIRMSVPGTTIPSVMISKSDADTFKAAAAFNPTTGVPANGANVTVFNDNGVISRGGGAADTMPTYSSRGPRLQDNALKPDITAPAEVVGVAASFSGSAVQLFNGTSSSAPHVAGSMALLRQLHPTWGQDELRSLAMNTATNDLFTSTARTTRRGISRVGAGRIDNSKSANGNVIVFNRSNLGQVSVSFGSVEVPVDGSVAVAKSVTIRDKRTSGGTIRYRATVDMVNPVGDANFSAPQSLVDSRPGQDVTFPLLFRATGNTLKHLRDPSVSNGQGVGGTTLGREFLTEAAGYGVLTPISGGGSEPAIRIPLYATVKPVGSMRAATTEFTPEDEFGNLSISLTGVPVNTGTAFPTDIIGLVKALELQYVSPLAGDPQAPNDPDVFKYVGVTSDFARRPASNKEPTVLTFAMEGFGDASVPALFDSNKNIYIDTNFDGVDDFRIYLDSIRITGTSTHSNVYYPVVARLNAQGGIIAGTAFYTGFPTNLVVANTRDVNTFNNSAVLVSVSASDLGYTGQGQSFFQYRAGAFNRDGEQRDLTPYQRFDIARPGVDATGPSGGSLEPFYHNDLPGTVINVAFIGANFRANNSRGILLVHRHNGRGNRTEVVTLRKPTITNFEPESGQVGSEVTITGSNFGNGTRVFFSPNVQAQVRVISERTLIATVPPGAVTGPITVQNAGGSTTSTKSFTVLPAPGPSPTPGPTVSPTAKWAPQQSVAPQPYAEQDYEGGGRNED